MTDLRRAFRTLRTNPSLTLTAILALAIGIGANTALFSIVDGVLLKPLNYPDADHIVELTRHYPGFDGWAVTPTKIDFWRRQNQSFSAMTATSFLAALVNFTGSGEPERVTALHVTSEYPEVFGATPVRGRFFNQQEDRPNAGHYAVLTYNFWARRFGKDPSVVGRSLTLGGASYTVLGIMPAGFASLPGADILLPLQLHVDPADRANDYRVIARLKPGVSLEKARQDMARVRDELRSQYGKDIVEDKETVGIYRYQDWLTRGVRPALVVLTFAVAFVLLIACANVANLLLARSATRQHEIAIQTALGAGAGQIVRQLLMESLVLSGAGAVAGVLLANLTLPFVISWAPSGLPEAARIQIDWRVLVFAAAVSVATGLLFGLFPALQSARLGIQNPLRDSGTRNASSGAAKWVRQSLVVFEVAISLVLLIGAGLLLRTFLNLSDVQPGFDPRNVLTMMMSIDDTRLDGTRPIAQMINRVQSRIESIDGISEAGATTTLPLRQGSDLPFLIIGRNMKPDNLPDERIRYISPHYFSVMRMKIVAGRDFTVKDTLDSPRVLIVNEAFVRKYFPHGSALGERVLVGATMGPIFNDQPREVVGVISNTREVSLGEAPEPMMFEPLAQVPEPMVRLFVKLIPLHWVVRTSHDPMAFADTIRRETLVASGGIPLADPMPLEQYVGDSISQQRFMMSLLGVFAGLAVFLGAIGIYGVISYGVAQRTRELGIRSALGAARTDLLRLVIREGMLMAGLGLVIGLIAAFGLTRFLQSMLYGVSPTEPATLIAVTALLALVALLACVVPARRAAGIDPAVALREE